MLKQPKRAAERGSKSIPVRHNIFTGTKRRPG
ncbi:hypothetical protein PSPO01_16454 [Paraphaeosphaeria sporulosa]